MGNRDFIARILTAIAETIPNVCDGAQPLGIHLEGPWLDPEQRGAFPFKVLHVPNLDEAREYVHAARGYLRLVTLAPNFPQSLDVARYLIENHICPSLGHSNTTYDVARDALEIFPLVTHVYNAMSVFHHRKPGVLGAVLSSDKPSGMLICDGLHAHPAAVKILFRSLGTDRVILITDSIPGGGMDEGEFVMLNQNARIVDGVARLANGTIAGSILTLNRAVMNARAFGDLSLNVALKMATQNPARILGLSNKGHLVAGADADVVVMDDAGDVMMTMVHGETVYRA
jgi:N-acetylglucosamine-6-phosphate deacetylase